MIYAWHPWLTITATEVEDIFASPGNPRRILHLETIFDTQPRYGKGFDWTGYTVQDCAGVFLRYLKSFPEGPVIPYIYYNHFSDMLRSYKALHDGIAWRINPDTGLFINTLKSSQDLIKKLPPLNRQLLLYVLDLMAAIATKSEINKMGSTRLAAAFHPGILSRRPEEMDSAEHELAVAVTAFLIDSLSYDLLDTVTGISTAAVS